MGGNRRWKAGWLCALLVLCAAGMASGMKTEDPEGPPPMQHDSVPTADHSGFEALLQEFTSPQEVTKACLGCHNQADDQLMKTIHWTWICPKEKSGKLGKAGYSLNNFCISIWGNEPRCTSCHAGYGWQDKTFDKSAAENIDCLVCHDQTGTYEKYPPGAGLPVTEPTEFKESGKTFLPPDYNAVARSVGRPTRKNCGTCHFYGGGGDGVKHGDLDSSLFNPSRSLDVHMAVDGQNFACTRCHTTKAHSIAGRCYQTPAATSRKSLLDYDQITRITCESCHSDRPHSFEKINDHTDIVACQSCHIPTFARVNPTKMSWDWSAAGKMKDGKPYAEKGDLGKDVYMTKKGAFTWEKFVVPEYGWFNGVIKNTLLTDKIDPLGVVPVNFIDATRDTPNARIYPFKVHQGRQPYDKINQTLAAPKLFGPKGSGAFWSDFDWKTAIEKGMEQAELPFSGEYDFVDTEYRYPTTHMVAPKENALACAACHVSESGRMAELTGFYMPGRDRHPLLNRIGWAGVILALAAVGLHGLGRIFGTGKKG